MLVSSSYSSPLAHLSFLVVAALLTTTLFLLGTARAAGNPEEYFGGGNNNTEAYLTWVESLGSEYPRTVFVPSSADPNKGVAIHWRIDEEYLDLAIAVQASGWMGFGLTVVGGMTGSDMVIVESSDLTVAKDAHVLDVRSPQEDDCQDWQMVAPATLQGGFLMARLRRKVDTGDAQDLAIQNDADFSFPVSRVIAAWGDSSTVSYHGPDDNARGALRWYGQGALEQEVFEAQMKNQSQGMLVVGAKNYSIPVADTTYAYFCVNSQDLEGMGVNMSEGVTIVGFDAEIDASKYVHHYLFHGVLDEIENPANCSRATARGELVYPWGPGEPPFFLPDNLGFKLGGSDGYRSFILEIHYDNVDLDENQVDSSGVKVFYSSTPREITAGFITIGDPFVALVGQDIDVGVTDYGFACPGECSGLMIQEPVTVLREYLHMHKSGYATSLEQIRDGTVVHRSSVDFYDFDQSGGPAVQFERYEVQPGDSFTMKCYYKNEEEGRKFGLGSSEEMCMAFVLYYPRAYLPVTDEIQSPWLCGVGFANFGLPQCETTVTTRVLSTDETPNRTFGTSSDVCEDGGSSGGNVEEPSSGGSRILVLSSLALSCQLGTLISLFW